jgi:hypothetical protein
VIALTIDQEKAAFSTINGLVHSDYVECVFQQRRTVRSRGP